MSESAKVMWRWADYGDGVLLPEDTLQCFAYLVSRCASGAYQELVDAGKTDVQARTTVIHTFMNFAAGEACRVARKEGREPDETLWRAATDDAFSRAVQRTAAPPDTPKEETP